MEGFPKCNLIVLEKRERNKKIDREMYISYTLWDALNSAHPCLHSAMGHLNT